MSENDTHLQTFNVSIEQFAKILDVAPGIVTRRIVYDAHGRISRRTPVDTGRARGSWDVKIGAPSDFVPPVTVGSVRGKGKSRLGKGLAGNKLGSGAASGGKIKDIGAEIAAIDGTKVVFITSNLDYMKFLEGGSSKQAPVGMVLISIAEIEVEMESIIEQLTP